MNQTEIKKILEERGLAPSKQLGQNFLIQPGLAEKIINAAGITADDQVIELGVGLGALTRPLAAGAARVIGLEIDSGIIKYHRETQGLPANVELRHQDLLHADFTALAEEVGGRVKIIANLPYAITNPLLFKLVEQHRAVKQAVLMIQKEVALRLTAKPSTKDYGVLSVLLGTCATVQRLLEVGPANFYPRPKVDSVVIAINFHERPVGLENIDLALLRRVVDSAFGQRRKTLLNSLSAGGSLGLDRNRAAAVLAAAGIDQRLRAENLSTADFLRLSQAVAAQPKA
ncbi:16S rRNA (adenine(1518)-N(6)/adenine(1519)-N(6))-dimethyltransferase RsmA [Desulfurivibrio dismutans]|uniref:16S rRNA (adenine(1518)-N(6)/adenine(1519)-N(6))- dimethyltransferase RsmA n=1 Tax=Desulfurivibrio dismutans TaxID=1398908 RepID=UPI0023DBD1FF|nr:16S rRNA (adenine(1518)-N(6)/adenine(1519)-N(6))-dimethyltransferase RsmA [Desulfurivibrio alkaliphilus]MDF1615283.1 16S rRNA (adenine(1518)-N(6)/adenine(1519)-N(6))-dimethyltransferase RsmA [Desulfurivibrio alkaliphilus]